MCRVKAKRIAISKVGLTAGDECKLYYGVKGTGVATVVLLHDGLLDSRVWDEQIETFARYHTVIHYDRRGYGRSEIPSTKFTDSKDLHPCTAGQGRYLFLYTAKYSRQPQRPLGTAPR